MSQETEKTGISRFKAVKRSAVRLSTEELVKTSYFDSEGQFPVVVEPQVEGLNLALWASGNREQVESLLLKHGAILFRNFNVETVDQFQQFARAVSPELLDYQERAAPRTEVSSNVYTSTEFPADHWIPLHHEMSYSHNWPTKIMFYCAQPATEGGSTPITSDRKIFNLIPAEIKEKFMRKRVMYVRNYGEGVDLSWQEAFQTTDRAVVENYCRRARTEFEWRDGDRLRTRQVRQAIAVHPRTGETVWFNHAHMFHVSSLAPEVRDSLLSTFAEEDLPRNALFGDGSTIPAMMLDEIRAIYHNNAVSFPWQKGDVMLLDNFLASHGRAPFSGPRKILVAMSELYVNEDI